MVTGVACVDRIGTLPDLDSRSLRWDRSEWGDILLDIPVDALPDGDAREFIRGQIGPVASGIEDQIIEVSRRIPFFLEAMINAYALEATVPGALPILPRTPAGSIQHLLDHLEADDRTMAIVLAVIQVFDERLFGHLSRFLNLSLGPSAFERFSEWFFVEPASNGLLKTHDLLTELVRETGGEGPIKRAALEGCGTYILASARGDGLRTPEKLLSLFKGVLSGWRHTEHMPVGSVELLVDVGYVLYDAGYWSELAVPDPTGVEELGPSGLITRFFATLAARRVSGPLVGLQMLGEIADEAGLLGRHSDSVALELAYMSEIAGNYARARQEFRDLNERAVPFDPTKREHVRTRLYHSDVLIMDGLFSQGSRLLLETYEAIGATAPLDWSELVRHRGHAFRFSFDYEQAEYLYRQAMSAADGAPALQAKLCTNLAETLCWHNPADALEAAAESVEMNLRLGNQIEIVKCHIARGISFARQGEVSSALDTLRTAVTEAVAVGYPAGSALGLQAVALANAWLGQPDAAWDRVADLRRLVSDLGTYRHLLAAPFWLLGDDAEFFAIAGQCEWMDPDSLRTLVTQAVGAFGSGG